MICRWKALSTIFDSTYNMLSYSSISPLEMQQQSDVTHGGLSLRFFNFGPNDMYEPQLLILLYCFLCTHVHLIMLKLYDQYLKIILESLCPSSRDWSDGYFEWLSTSFLGHVLIIPLVLKRICPQIITCIKRR